MTGQKTFEKKENSRKTETCTFERIDNALNEPSLLIKQIA